jgi:hypothetical protein
MTILSGFGEGDCLEVGAGACAAVARRRPAQFIGERKSPDQPLVHQGTTCSAAGSARTLMVDV